MDFENNLSRNIRTLRETQNVTQEQLATALNISFQAISKWENRVTVPDTLMIPKIAQYFGTTIDDLFRPELNFYRNNAIKLLAVYEQSWNQDDFIRADAEFNKLFESGNYTQEDIRAYGLLYEYHMSYCKDKALKQYDKIIASNAKDELYYRTRRQKTLLLSRIGQVEEGIAQEQKNVKENPNEVENYVCLIAAYYWAKQYEKGFQVFQEAVSKFPTQSAELYTYGGDICREMHQYNEAFTYWNKALEISDKYIDAMYSIAFCYHELQKYEEEITAWQRIMDWLREKGATYELQFPKEKLKEAKENQILDNVVS